MNGAGTAGAAGALLVLLAVPGAAIELRGGERVVVAAGEIVDDDLYATGETVTVDGIVRGDLVAAARVVTLNGEIGGDLIAAGQAVIVAGRVGDDARIAGMALRLAPGAAVGDDLIAAGLGLEGAPGSRVGGSLQFNGLQALLAGEVAEGAMLAAAGAELRGTIRGAVQATVDAPAPPPPFVGFLPSPIPLPAVPMGLTVADGAEIGGDLRYTAPAAAAIAAGAQVAGAVSHTPSPAETRTPPTAGARLLQRLRNLLSLALVGLLLAWWAPGWLSGAAARLESGPLRALGWGVVVLLGVPMLMLALALLFALLAVLFAGLTLGRLAWGLVLAWLIAEVLLAGLFWIAIQWVAPILAGLFVGRLLLRRVAPGRAAGRALPLLAGLLLLAVLGAVPVVSPAVRLLVVLFGLGALAGTFGRSPGRPATSPPT